MNTKTATFAGGCFWCVEHDLRAIAGVIDAVSGYAGGDTPDPTYQDHGDHREAVQVTYDPNVTSFKKLSQFFLDHIDPTDAGGQFYDRGEAYKTAIYYSNDDEKAIALSLIKELGDSGIFPGETIAVQVFPYKNFYKAEDYHQDYADKNPMHYESYAKGSGRVTFVANTCNIRELKHIDWKE
ncbi:MAG: msrA3 [Patescibacteria group bacterium]|nr:msrA3 [Patescibacteria group bacterium]